MRTEIVTSGLLYWCADNEDQMQTAGIVNPRLSPKLYSTRSAFTVTGRLDEEKRECIRNYHEQKGSK